LAAGSCSPSNLDGCTQTTTLKISGAQWDGKTLKNCKIYNTGSGTSGGEGIFIEDVENLTVENCEIYNAGRAGIRLGISKSTRNVTLRGNTIHNVGADGISAGQRYADGVDHLGLKILNNTIYETGQAGRGEGLYHGMYIQASDFLIEGNYIHDASDGNGISVRSSGVIRGNLIARVGEGAITYYSDHMRGPSNLLLIENNIAYGNTNYGTIQLLSITNASQAVQNFRIRFNTAVSMLSAKAALAIGSGYSSYKTEVYGNILINSAGGKSISGTPSMSQKNYTSTSLQGFKNPGAPYDLHLTSSHPARGFATGVASFPSQDFDGDNRSAASLDAGADQFSSATNPPPDEPPPPTEPPPSEDRCSLTILSPNGGEQFRRGQTLKVAWSGQTTVSGSLVQLLLLKGTKTYLIVNSTANDGSYSVRIPSTSVTGTDFKVMVLDKSDSSCFDVSNANFRISN
jgi:parallel beta-helix repeat protein